MQLVQMDVNQEREMSKSLPATEKETNVFSTPISCFPSSCNVNPSPIYNNTEHRAKNLAAARM